MSKTSRTPSESDDRHEIEILPGLQVTLRYLLTYNGHTTLAYSFYSTSTTHAYTQQYDSSRRELDWLRVSDATCSMRLSR
jgi:hypothetical protein